MGMDELIGMAYERTKELSDAEVAIVLNFALSYGTSHSKKLLVEQYQFLSMAFEYIIEYRKKPLIHTV